MILSENTDTLLKVNLSLNHFGDLGIVAFVPSQQQCGKLSKLSLKNCSLTAASCEAHGTMCAHHCQVNSGEAEHQ